MHVDCQGCWWLGQENERKCKENGWNDDKMGKTLIWKKNETHASWRFRIKPLINSDA